MKSKLLINRSKVTDYERSNSFLDQYNSFRRAPEKIVEYKTGRDAIDTWNVTAGRMMSKEDRYRSPVNIQKEIREYKTSRKD